MATVAPKLKLGLFGLDDLPADLVLLLLESVDLFLHLVALAF